jgi:hypothetical protein
MFEAPHANHLPRSRPCVIGGNGGCGMREGRRERERERAAPDHVKYCSILRGRGPHPLLGHSRPCVLVTEAWADRVGASVPTPTPTSLGQLLPTTALAHLPVWTKREGIQGGRAWPSVESRGLPTIKQSKRSRVLFRWLTDQYGLRLPRHYQ